MKIESSSTAMAAIERGKTVQQQVQEKSFEEALKKAAESGDDTKLKEACQEFESVFLNMMLQTMRKTIPEGGLIEKSQATETFESMLDDEYAKNLSKAGGIGLADLMMKQLKNKG